MKCSVYIATSADGFIARRNGDIDWLANAGNTEVDLGDQSDLGFAQFMGSVDCIIMGRNCMDTLSAMAMDPAQWPYGDTRIVVLSRTIKTPAQHMHGPVEMYCGDLPALLDSLAAEGHQHAYVDGGKTIQSFLNIKRIDEITITQIPVILGDGLPLFGSTDGDIKLENARATAYPNDFIQLQYCVNYS